MTCILTKRLPLANLRYNPRMEKPLFAVSVVMRQVPIANRWVSEKWELAGIETLLQEGRGSVSSDPTTPATWAATCLSVLLHTASHTP